MPNIGRAPEFLALIQRAVSEPISIIVENRKLAQKLRLRFHSFRKRLKHDKSSPQSSAYSILAEQIETTITDLPDGRSSLIFRPAEWEFRQAFSDAGITVDSTPAPTPVDTPSNSSLDPLSAYLEKP